jgi:ABC-type transport system involved in cytochrome bd biosynthesis fused ATPase/permease subunit
METVKPLKGEARRWIALMVVIGVAIAALNIGQIALIGQAIDAVLTGTLTAASMLTAFALILLLRALLIGLSRLTGYRSAIDTKAAMRRAIYDHLGKVGPDLLNRERSGSVVNMAVEGVEALGPYFGLYLPQFFLGLVLPLFVCLAIMTMDWLSGLALLFIVPLIPILLMLVQRKFRAVSERYFATANRLSAQFLDSLQGLPTLKLFNQGKAQGQRLAAQTEALRVETMKLLLINQVALFFVDWVFSLGTIIAATVLAVTRLEAGVLTYGQAVMLLLLSLELSRPLGLLGSFFFVGALGRTSLKKIKALLQMPPPITRSVTGMTVPRIEPNIRFEAVSFTYPAGENTENALQQAALTAVSFEIKAGETVALVGPSGSGKSSIINLLLRFYEPQAGNILLGSCPLETYDVETLRHHIAYVGQSPLLFYGTVSDNLRIGKPDATQQELEAAARAAQAHEFIMRLPQGYETMLGERGARLSGGQSQRLAIARALLKDAPIILLDEPTSQMDTRTEALIQAALDALIHNKTVLIAASLDWR